MNAEVQDELLMLLRSQQRELTELRGQIEAMQSSIMAQVEHVLTSHQEQERILQTSFCVSTSRQTFRLQSHCSKIHLNLSSLRCLD